MIRSALSICAGAVGVVADTVAGVLDVVATFVARLVRAIWPVLLVPLVLWAAWRTR